MKFSLLLALYFREKPEHLRRALQSIVTQTVLPDEVVFVKDAGIPTELESVLGDFRGVLSITEVQLDTPVDLGTALQIGVTKCRHDIIARFDTDDIARPRRFERQLQFLRGHPEVDVVGAWINEFEDDLDHIYACKKFPLKHDEIMRFAKRRCPMAHMTVMLKKSAVVAAGNYQTMLGIGMEDYDLWVRMLVGGSRFANVPEVLVDVRAGFALSKRRGGVRHAYNEIAIQRRFLRLRFLSRAEFVRNVLTRVPFVLIPSSLRFAMQRAVFRDVPEAP